VDPLIYGAPMAERRDLWSRLKSFVRHLNPILPAVFISDSLTAAIQRAPDRARRATLVAATLFGFIAAWAALFAIALHPSQAWWSDSAPLWVAGVATAAGVFAAVVAAIYGAPSSIVRASAIGTAMR
jgi:hypothetical protein